MPRKLTRARPKLGAHLAALRQAAGLSQQALAKMIGVNQQTIAFWETNDKPPRSEVLLTMADALGVHVETLLSADRPPARRVGPVGRVRKVFEEVSQLPRRQQDRVLEFVLPFVSQHKRDDVPAT